MNTAEPTIYYHDQIPCLSKPPVQLNTGMCRFTLATGSSLGPCPSPYIVSSPYYGMRCANFCIVGVCDLMYKSIRTTQPTPLIFLL